MIMGVCRSHLQGIFYRTIRMMEQGIKPVFVFDGKPPVLKAGEVGYSKRGGGALLMCSLRLACEAQRSAQGR